MIFSHKSIFAYCFQQTTNHHHFDPIQLRRKQCSSTLIDEELPIISNSSSSSGLNFRSVLFAWSNQESIGFRSDSSNQTNDDEIESVNQRANIIREIYKTEYDYLGHLKNLVDVSRIGLVDFVFVEIKF